MTRTYVPYNAIFGKPLLDKLSMVLSLRYFLMKFEKNKGIIFVKGNQVKASMIVAGVVMKPLEIMILETFKEWYKRRERRTKQQKEPIKVKLDGPNRTTLAG